MPIDSRERIGPAVAAVVIDVGHESAHRMDSATDAGRRTVTGGQLPPPREVPDSRRRGRRVDQMPHGDSVRLHSENVVAPLLLGEPWWVWRSHRDAWVRCWLRSSAP